MNTLFIYMLKVAVYLIALYLVYSLLLSKDTSYVRNRIFILMALTVSLILPFITFQTHKPLNIQYFGKLLSEVFITASSNGSGTITSKSAVVDSLQIVYSIYAIGVIILIIKLLIDVLSLIFLILQHKNEGSRIIRFNGFNTSAFSAMGYIFINVRLSSEEAGEIIRHEQNHLRKNHFMDILFIETIKTFQWFNPVVYLFNRSLRAIHEYQADQECLSSGVPIVNYQSLLLSQVFKSGAINLTNSFSNPSLIRKRMIMMTKKRTSDIACVKLLLAIPVIGLVFLAISAYKEIPNPPDKQIVFTTVPDISSSTTSSSISKVSSEPSVLSSKPLKNTISTAPRTNKVPTPVSVSASPPPSPPVKSLEVKEEDNNITGDKTAEEVDVAPFVVVEEMPMFPGGDGELLKFITANTNYPEVAKTNNIQGRVIIRFAVTAKGSVSKVSVLKGVSPELDAEAIRVVEALPEFNPGKQGGKPVPVWYMVPITFTLK
jgi:TonB family protein